MNGRLQTYSVDSFQISSSLLHVQWLRQRRATNAERHEKSGIIVRTNQDRQRQVSVPVYSRRRREDARGFEVADDEIRRCQSLH